MISPHTPPGTKVVCVLPPTVAFWTNGQTGLPFNLKLGEVYTISLVIEAAIESTPVFVATVEEIEPLQAFGLECFRYLDLPRSITALLSSQPVKDRETVE